MVKNPLKKLKVSNEEPSLLKKAPKEVKIEGNGMVKTPKKLKSAQMNGDSRQSSSEVVEADKNGSQSVIVF
jgi:rhamnose utilization protein RhaD (predicted bifunctional aldolase and dehydrogenase)